MVILHKIEKGTAGGEVFGGKRWVSSHPQLELVSDKEYIVVMVEDEALTSA